MMALILAALAQFQVDYQRSVGQPVGTALTGVQLTMSHPASSAGLYYKTNTSPAVIVREDFACDASGCVALGTRASQPASNTAQNLGVAEFEKGLKEAVELFEQKNGKADLIQNAKLWQSGSNLYVAFKWTQSGKGEQTVYMMCHQHGAHFDCHRQSRPGQGEPTF